MVTSNASKIHEVSFSRCVNNEWILYCHCCAEVYTLTPQSNSTCHYNIVVIIHLGKPEWLWNHIEMLIWTLCEWSSASLQSCSISSHQVRLMSSSRVKVMCAMAAMSFHSSFHFKALCLLAHPDEVWISFLPLHNSNLSQSGRTTCPACILG